MDKNGQIAPVNVPIKKIDNISKIIGTGPDTIKIIKNFIPQSDIDEFVNFGKIMSKVEKNKTHHFIVNATDPVLQEKFKKYENMLRNKAEELYGLKLNKDRPLDLFIHPEGSYLEPHTDIIDYHQEEVYDQPNLFAEQEKVWPFLWSGHLSILCYLNKDYDGGVLYFPDQGVEIVPEPGMFVCFPGNLHFLHGVTQTTGATRFTLSLWTRFSDFKNEIIESESESLQEPVTSEYFKVEDIATADPKKIFTDSTRGEDKIKDKATIFLGTNKDTIKIVKNFMPKDDLAVINELCNFFYRKDKIDEKNIPIAKNLILEYKEKIKNISEDLFKLKLEHDDDANTYNIKSSYLNGRLPYFATNIHSDILTDFENNIKYDWSGHISNLLYLNDDYDGGELYFPEHDFKIKPEPGMLVSFPGNWYNRHGIMPASDFRYAINVFVKISGYPDQPEYI